jgi:hypothetical protein
MPPKAGMQSTSSWADETDDDKPVDLSEVVQLPAPAPPKAAWKKAEVVQPQGLVFEDFEVPRSILCRWDALTHSPFALEAPQLVSKYAGIVFFTSLRFCSLHDVSQRDANSMFSIPRFLVLAEYFIQPDVLLIDSLAGPKAGTCE